VPTLSKARNIDGMLEVIVSRLTTSYSLNRLQPQDVLHHEAKVIHPEHAGIMSGGGSLFPISGAMSVTWGWSEADDTTVKASMSDWEAMIARPDITVTKDLDNRQVTATIDGDYNHSDWVSHPFEYVPLSTTGQLGGDNSDVVCISRLIDPTGWSTQYIHSDSSVTVDKAGTDCYVYCSSPVSVSGTNYDAHKVFNLTSESVVITPESRCLFVRVSK
jgi:hypothetical protein